MHDDESKDQHRRDDRQRARQLHHRGEIARLLAEGIACRHNARCVVHGRSGPQTVGRIGQAEPAAEDREQHDHRHVEQERRGHTVGHVDIRRVNDGRDGRNGRAAADARSGRDEVAHLPVQAERLADEIADAEAGGQREKHDRQRKAADLQHRHDVQARAEQDDGELQYLFGREADAGRRDRVWLEEAVDDHADEQRNDGCADQMQASQPLEIFQPLGRGRNDERHCQTGHHFPDRFHKNPPFFSVAIAL